MGAELDTACEEVEAEIIHAAAAGSPAAIFSVPDAVANAVVADVHKYSTVAGEEAEVKKVKGSPRRSIARKEVKRL